MLKDFKAFILRGNVIDMAVGIIIGIAFSAIVASLVKDVIMPPIGLLLGKIDFADLLIILKQGNPVGPYPTLDLAQKAGAVTLNYGFFINTVISFIILAAVVFLFVVRPIAHLTAPKKAAAPPAPTTKECPFCLSNINIKATKCPNCTSTLTK
jgi:large conductance mechanosensitive channel